MSEQFIFRVVSGQERRALFEAAKRVDCAWMPFEFASTRPARKRHSTVTVRPLMGYLFCEGNAAQRRHLMNLRGVFGPVWFIPDLHRATVQRWQADVQATFDANRQAWMNNARLFHCQFKRGQSVRLKMQGLDLFQGKFKAVNPDGTYDIDGPFGRITAEPGSVVAA
jgi:hypothetical protein